MRQSKIEFKSLNLSVQNVDKSVRFYMDLGFCFGTLYETTDYRCADMLLFGDDVFILRLIEYSKGGEAKPKFVISLGTNEKAGITYEMMLEELIMKDISFENLDPCKLDSAILEIGLISDPDGNKLEFIDTSGS